MSFSWCFMVFCHLFCHFSLMSFMFWWFYNVFVMFQLFSVIFSNFPMVFFTFHWFSSFFNLRSLILFNFWFVVFLFSGILQCFNEFVDLMLEIKDFKKKQGKWQKHGGTNGRKMTEQWQIEFKNDKKMTRPK